MLDSLPAFFLFFKKKILRDVHDFVKCFESTIVGFDTWNGFSRKMEIP